jgi:hypothetical protein
MVATVNTALRLLHCEWQDLQVEEAQHSGEQCTWCHSRGACTIPYKRGTSSISLAHGLAQYSC